MLFSSLRVMLKKPTSGRPRMSAAVLSRSSKRFAVDDDLHLAAARLNSDPSPCNLRPGFSAQRVDGVAANAR